MYTHSTGEERMTFRDMQDVLYNELRLMHFPVAVKYLFDESELAAFLRDGPEYVVPVKPLTFCQWETAPRMKGQTVLGTRETLWCSNARYVLGWKPLDEAEVKSHAKYTRDMEQARRFVQGKPRLPEGELVAVIVSPLADSFFDPSTVHFYCDNMQAYHLCVDYMAATDVHPLQTNVTINSSACGGNVHAHLTQKATLLPACSGSYNAGKTERGEINVMIPGPHIEAVVHRLLERKETYGSSSLTRPGDGFPGADVCKNCPLIIFRKGDRTEP